MTERPGSIQILVAGHSLVVPSNRARWERLAERHADVNVTLVAPVAFRTARYGTEQCFRVKPEERGNYRVRPLKTTSRGLYRSCVLEFRGTPPDIVQVNEEPTEWVLLQVFLASRLLAPHSVRLFYYATNILADPDRWHRRAKLQTIYRLADGAFAGSRDAERVLRTLGFRDPVFRQTEIGADERTWIPRTSRTQPSPFTIGFVGALVRQKGVQDLARAVIRLRGEWRLVLVGDGPERATLESLLLDAGVEHRIDFMGVLERDALPTLMRNFDVLVLPSRTTPPLREQFGLVLAEAMLSGVAVVGSDSGAIPEVIGDDGLVFPEGDHLALAAHLQLLKDEVALRERLAASGRERALRTYSASALADQTYELYRAFIDDHHAGILQT